MKPARAAWMRGRFGLMVHYLLEDGVKRFTPDGAWCDSAVRSAEEIFSVERLMEAVDRSGADWLVFPFGQNTGFFNAPNDVIERRVGRPCCSTRRDLFGEVAEAIAARGKRLIAYSTCDNECGFLCEAFGVKPGRDGAAWPWAWADDPGIRSQWPFREFQRNWREALAFWSRRYGPLVSGWWIDGCFKYRTAYHGTSNDPAFNRYDGFEFPEWFAALRAGNPDSAVAFNDSGFINPVPHIATPDEDYYAGEADRLFRGEPYLQTAVERFRPFAVHGGPTYPGTSALMHILVPIDAFWAHLNDPSAVHRQWTAEFGGEPVYRMDPEHPETMEPPCYPDDDLRRLLDVFCGNGGAATFNCGVFDDGSIGAETLAQLERIARA
jgi:hypothetical protein